MNRFPFLVSYLKFKAFESIFFYILALFSKHKYNIV